LPPARRLRRGFTIAEVMMAGLVLALGIASSIIVLQQGMRSVDTARNTTIAGQVLQSMMEDLRLQTWAQVSALQAASNNGTSGNAAIDSSFIGTDATAAALLARFTITRRVGDVTGQTGMKTITLTAQWIGIDGRTHSVNYTSYYAQHGLYDYYVS
jgi:Tfp pilus assembly protein PilV